MGLAECQEMGGEEMAKSQKVTRSSVTGRFVTKSTGVRSPRTTQTETVKRGK